MPAPARRGLVLAVLLVLLSSLLLVAGATAADAASRTRCQRGSSMEGGRCWTRHQIYRHLKVVEAVPLENRSHKTGTFHCTFSRNISQSVEAGYSVAYEAKVSIMKLVDAGTTMTLHMNVSQTASQATEAGASFRLKPGQRVVCQRTYGYVTTRIKDYRWWGSTGAHAGSSTHYYTVKVPARLGIRVVD
ncbi:MAG: hypothetical protein ACTHJH_17115 [Marmoricola sp.]